MQEPIHLVLRRKDVRSKKAKGIGSIPMMGFFNFQTLK
jgi:hypothetical protein